MTTTTQVRLWWAPACKANQASLTDAYQALDDILKKWGYAPRQGVTGAFNCRPITGGDDYSLHAYDPDGFFTFWSGVRVTKALAVDINWDTNGYGPELETDMPLGMVLEIQQIKTKNGKQVWRSGRFYTNNKDAMHYEIIVHPDDLATGIVMPSTPTDPGDEPQETYKETDPMLVIRRSNREQQLFLSGGWTIVAHKPLMLATPTTPTVEADEDMWKFLVGLAKMTKTLVDPRPKD